VAAPSCWVAIPDIEVDFGHGVFVAFGRVDTGVIRATRFPVGTP
jgi:hypothetical protein